ncbi:hypothetical protein ACP4OV_003972 [Aristida adscensionis]
MPLHRRTLYDVFPMLPRRPFGVNVHEVWADNLTDKLRDLTLFARRVHYVAVKVHYPGVVHGAGRSHHQTTPEERYAAVKADVDALKPIQLGLAVCTYDGELAAWEFNLRDFHPAADPHDARSVAYLAGRGLDFDRHREHGIAMADLATALDWSGLIGRPGMSWITQGGAYHAAYLLKVLRRGAPLPGDMAWFLEEVRGSIGDVYDVARIAGDCSMPVGLECIARTLDVAPPLLSPQLAGGGSVLLVQAFITLKFVRCPGNLDRYRGLLKGLQVL